MIVHKISKLFVYNVIQQIKDKYRPQQQQQQVHYPVTPILTQDNENYPSLLRDKLRYSRWLDEVRQQWELGSVVTLRILHVNPNSTKPPPSYLIHGYEEMRHLCSWDTVSNEPKSIRLIPYKTHIGAPVWVAPSMIRSLLPEERKLVDALNQETVSHQVH